MIDTTSYWPKGLIKRNASFSFIRGRPRKRKIDTENDPSDNKNRRIMSTPQDFEGEWLSSADGSCVVIRNGVASVGNCSAPIERVGGTKNSTL